MHPGCVGVGGHVVFEGDHQEGGQWEQTLLNVLPNLFSIALSHNPTPKGPPLPPCAGSLLNILGLILFGVSQSSGPNAFIPASIFLGLGGITFHLAQMHASALYPRKRGMLTAVFVAGFTGSGIIFYLLLLIFQAAGSTRLVARGAGRGSVGRFSLELLCLVRA